MIHPPAGGQLEVTLAFRLVIPTSGVLSFKENVSIEGRRRKRRRKKKKEEEEKKRKKRRKSCRLMKKRQSFFDCQTTIMDVKLILVSTIMSLLLYKCIKYIKSRIVLYQKFQKLSPPRGSWLFGHYKYLITSQCYRGLDNMNALQAGFMLAKTEPFVSNGLLPVWFGSPAFGWPLVIPTRTEIVNALLSSKEHVNKAFYYDMIRDFFGTGLVVSQSCTWSYHRKLLNPTFNLKLLHQFNGIMNKHARRLVSEISQVVSCQVSPRDPCLEGSDSCHSEGLDSCDGKGLDSCHSEGLDSCDGKGWITHLPELLSKATMGIICETALGTDAESSMNHNACTHDGLENHACARDGTENKVRVEVVSGYTEAAEEFDKLMLNRLGNPLMCIDFFYKFTEEGRRHAQIKTFLKSEGLRLIKERIQKMNQQSQDGDSENGIEECSLKGRKSCLIDTLIIEHMRNPAEMTIEAISDEVDTFLAAGHDTTTWALVWTLFLLGHHPEIQDKIREEFQEVASDEYNQINYFPMPNSGLEDESGLEDGSDNHVTPQVVSKLRYLECVINESLRMYPVVPFYGRKLEKDLDYAIDGNVHTIPAGTHFVIHPDLIHQSNRYYDNPERFIPERFMTDLSGNKHLGENPFISFSLGPRNCIGKTFAKLEEKIILIRILNEYEIVSLTQPDQVKLNYALARRCKEKLRFKFLPRKNYN